MTRLKYGAGGELHGNPGPQKDKQLGPRANEARNIPGGNNDKHTFVLLWAC